MNGKYFIKTFDKETADKLKEAGFELLSCSNGLYTFVNDSNLSLGFSATADKLQFSNKLEF